MSSLKEKVSKNFLFERISRVRLFLLFRKNIVFFVFLLLLLLSFVLGLWQIKRYEIYESYGEEIDPSVENSIVIYLEKNVIGKNYFNIFSVELEKDMYKSLSYIKGVRIEKILPNKIIAFVDIFEEKAVGYMRGEQCLVLSETGLVLEEICQEEDSSCCFSFATENNLYIFESGEVDSTNNLNGKTQILIFDDISKAIRVVEKFGLKVENVKLENSILEVKDSRQVLFRFTLASDLDIQLSRFLAVMGKVVDEDISFKSLDLRFDRPVMKK